ncbi:MAG: hypothetical protein EAS48_02855 [Chryseobacterium sp.]|nr:MAG: hypothetical protein EAS48_02855 [Chryseobacterium sp.]
MSFLAGFLAHLTGQPWDNIHQGVFGFNAALSAIVFASRRITDVAWAVIATLLTLVINIILVEGRCLDPIGGVLTFAFVTGTWLTLLLQRFAARYRH